VAPEVHLTPGPALMSSFRCVGTLFEMGFTSTAAASHVLAVSHSIRDGRAAPRARYHLCRCIGAHLWMCACLRTCVGMGEFDFVVLLFVLQVTIAGAQLSATPSVVFTAGHVLTPTSEVTAWPSRGGVITRNAVRQGSRRMVLFIEQGSQIREDVATHGAQLGPREGRKGV